MLENTDADNELENVVYKYASSAHQLEGENRLLRETINHLKHELEKYRRPALMVCEVVEVYNDKAIIKTPNGNMFYVDISSDAGTISPGDTVVAEQRNLTIIDKIPLKRSFNVGKYVIIEKPEVKWSDIGGLKSQIKEIKEVIELPLKSPKLFEKIGITPPKGILLYGPPGTGKTLLAKAVAASTKSTFIEIVGSELVQKFIGEGAKMIKEIFELAKEKAPSIIFIDEIDALAAVRIDIGTSGEREVQRTFMQLLAELDGFKPLGNVKVIGCTNRKDILDPAITRPGRLDRLIYVPIPDEDGVKSIFNIYSKSMSLDKSIDRKKIIKSMLGLSGAEIKAVLTEAGYFAIREKRHIVVEKDISSAIKKIKGEEEKQSFLEMFG